MKHPSTPTTHILPADEAPLLRQNVDSASNRPEQNPVSNNESIVESSIYLFRNKSINFVTAHMYNILNN